MRPPFRSLCTCLIAIPLLVTPVPATAQSPDSGARIGFLVGGSFGDGGQTAGIGVSAGYRFNPPLGVELNVSHLPGLDFGEFPACPPDVFCIAVPVSGSVIGGTFSLRGRATSYTVNLVSEMPTRIHWLRPYISGGGGVASVRRVQQHTFFNLGSTTSATDPVLTVGGGVDFLVWRGLAVGVELRYLRVFEEDQFGRSDVPHNLNVTSLGSLVSYRF